jgi:hypothetical protein
MMRRRKRARDYGDNPRIRHSHREHKRINLRQSWERQYAGIKKTQTRVSPHLRRVPNSPRRVRVRGHLRKLR